LSSTQSADLEKLLQRFEDAWQNGQRPIIETYLPDGDTGFRQAALAELVHVDLERRLKAGEDVTPQAYLERFPELAATPERMKSLIAAARALEHYRLSRPARATSEPPANSPQHSSAATKEWSRSAAGLSDRIIREDESLPAVPGYVLLKVLGRGGMGIVYKARDIQLGRLVALKMILAGEHAAAEPRVRFAAEARVVASLQHPNIVQIHQVGECHGQHYLALEYVDGGSLDQKLAGIPQPARPTAALVETLARALDAAHAKGIVHRDLKPGNVLLMIDGTPKISDFGLAKQLDSDSGQTRTGTVVGTPSYMAPEQAAGHVKEITPATDVYALGALLYEMLTGQPPFRGATPFETLSQVLADDPIPPSHLVSRVPRDLELICLKCLEKAPSQRYASAAQMADDLQHYLAGEAISLRPAWLGDRLRRTLGQSRWRAELQGWGYALMMCAGVVLLAHVVLDYLYRTRQPLSRITAPVAGSGRGAPAVPAGSSVSDGLRVGPIHRPAEHGARSAVWPLRLSVLVGPSRALVVYDGRGVLGPLLRLWGYFRHAIRGGDTVPSCGRIGVRWPVEHMLV
jgi:hypothetical protein